MPFNLGLHPGFKVPLSADEKFEDYKFIFDEAGTYDCPAVNLTNGTIDFNTVARHFDNLKELPLNYDDYQNDALVFDNLATHRIHLVNKDKTHGVSLNLMTSQCLAFGLQIMFTLILFVLNHGLDVLILVITIMFLQINAI